MKEKQRFFYFLFLWVKIYSESLILHKIPWNQNEFTLPAQ